MIFLLGLLFFSPRLEADVEKEQFLATARIIRVEGINTGVTKPLKARLERDGVQHDAQIQSNDTALPPFFGAEGQRGIPMRDSWRYNVAAYRMDRMLGLDLIPVTITRFWQNKQSAFTWWVDNVQMDEAERLKRKLEAPNSQALQDALADAKVFDELILNIDRNLGNLLYTKDWRLVLIDHTRSFVAWGGIRKPENLTRCSQHLLTAMKRMTESSVRRAAGDALTREEVKALISRRDKIVARFSGSGAKDVF